MLQSKINATSPEEAIAIFINGISPTLDSWAYEKNIPIWLHQIICHDTQNNTIKTKVLIPHHDQSLEDPASQFASRLIPIFALYREAKNSVSVYYKFLCLYKILEGIFKRIRPDEFKAMKEKGLNLKSVIKKENVPDHKFISHTFPDKVGMPIQKLFETYLQDQFRDAIAHFAKEDTNPLWLSDYNVWSKYSNLLNLMEICCRIVIENEERIWKHFEENGL